MLVREFHVINRCLRSSASIFLNRSPGNRLILVPAVNLVRNFASFSNSDPSTESENKSYNIANESITNLPNMITMSRIISSPFIGLAIAYDMKEVALGGIVYAAISDWLDGFIAKRFNKASTFGSLLDPLADKIFIGSLTAALAVKGLLPLPLTVVILGRDLLLISGSFYLRWKQKPKDAPFFDTTYSATFTANPGTLSKANTALQFAVLITSMANFTLGSPSLEVLEPLWWTTGITTILSGLSYLDGRGIRRISKSA